MLNSALRSNYLLGTMQTPAHILVTDRLGSVNRVPLVKPVFTMGRHIDNDLQILSSSVSRHHAEILLEEGSYYITDKGSKSGTFVNGVKIVRQKLRDLDRIQLGSDEEYEIRFEVAGPEEGAGERRPGQGGPAVPPFNARAELKNLAKFLEVNQALNISVSIEEVLHLIVDAAVEITGADRGALLLRNELGEIEFRAARDRDRRTLSSDRFSISRTAVDQAFHGGPSVVFSDLDGQPAATTESALQLELHTVVCIPIHRLQACELADSTRIFPRDVVGTLYVDSRRSTDALSKVSVKLLESLAVEASRALESLRLMQEEEQKRRMELEFAMAREVQVALLTNSALETDKAEAAAHSKPSRYVDGDFYDLLTLEDGRSVVVLGDVSGKGIAAALLASMSQGILDAQLRSGQSLPSVITGLNRLLVRKSAPSKFVTLFCAALDCAGNLCFVNAGHNPPILLRAGGELETLAPNAMIVGAFDFARYSEGRTQLKPEDVLVAFSDGVTEATAVTGEMFGDERLAASLRSASRRRASEIVDSILADVAAFTHGLPQADDITIVVLKMKR